MRLDLPENSIQAEVEWRKICGSSAYFIEHYWHVPDRSRASSGTVDIKLYPYQADDLAWFESDPTLRALILKGRQIGYSTLVGGYAFWLAATAPSSLVLYFSEVQRLARKTVAAIRRAGYGSLPGWLQERCRIVNKAVESIEFANGAAIEALAGGESPARGESPTLIVLDEWPRHKDPEGALASALPAAESGQIIALGTGKGEAGSHYHSQWVDAERGESEWQPRFHGWRSVPDRDRDWYEQRRREFRHEPHLLTQEHPDSPDEVFFETGDTIFPTHLLAAHEPVEPARGDLLIRDHIPYFAEHMPGVQDEERFLMWEAPQTRTKYFVGGDVAGAQESGDYSSISVFSDTGKLVAGWHGWTSSVEFARLLIRIGVWYANAMLIVEATGGYGDVVNQMLLDQHYPNVFHMKRRARRAGTVTAPQPGFPMSNRNKQAAVEIMYHALAGDELEIGCARTVHELSIFRRLKAKGTMGAPAGSHDDRAISAMLGVWGVARYGRIDEPTPELAEASPLWGTLDFWVQNQDEMPVSARLPDEYAHGADSRLAQSPLGGLLPSATWHAMNTSAHDAARNARKQLPFMGRFRRPTA